MADPFGEGLFSVFDEEQQSSGSKKIPASISTDTGCVDLRKRSVVCEINRL